MLSQIKELYDKAVMAKDAKESMSIDPRDLIEIIQYVNDIQQVLYCHPKSLFINDPLIAWLTEKEILPRLRYLIDLEESKPRRI